MRTAGSKRDITWPLIQEAAIKMLYERGFAAMNVRDLAAEVGLKSGSLYNYFESKEQFLLTLLTASTDEIFTDVSTKVENAGDPIQKMDAFVKAHIEWYTLRRQEIFIGSSEMRNFSGENRKTFIALRKRYERVLIKIIADGVAAKQFDPVDPKVAAFSLLSMLSGLSVWYRPDGRIKLAKIIQMHIGWVHKMLGVDPAYVSAGSSGSRTKSPAARKKADLGAVTT